MCRLEALFDGARVIVHRRPKCILVATCLILSGVPAASCAELVTNEVVRIEVLRTAFPQTNISVSQKKPLDWKASPWPGHDLTDALSGEKEYDEVGNLDKSEETWATGVSEPDMNDTHETRRLRVRVYEMSNGRSTTYVALANYTFVGIQDHSFCCEWFARLFVVSRQGTGWNVQRTNDSLVNRAKTIRSFQLIDLDGDGREEVLVEAENTATGYRRWITMNIFGIDSGTLIKLAEVDTLSTNDAIHTQYSRELDAARTRGAAGKSIFFRSTVYGTEHKQYSTPRIVEDAVIPSPKKLN